MKRIAVVTKNVYLFQKIKLALSDRAQCILAEGGEGCDLCLVDLDSAAIVPSGAVSMSRTEACDLKIPFLISDLIAVTQRDKKASARLCIDKQQRAAILDGRRLKLTELEFKLISLLVSEARYFSKAEILRHVWGGDADDGIVNVYVHYLREKLEAGTEKIILSSRGNGYKINEKFLDSEGDLQC